MIRISLFSLTLLICRIVTAQTVDYTGIYSHQFEGEISYLEIIQDEKAISGELHDSRGVYYLHGEIEENRGKGFVNVGSSTHFFEMDKVGEFLNLTIISMNDYGEPDYATEYEIIFEPDLNAEVPEKIKSKRISETINKDDASSITAGGIINAPYHGFKFSIPSGFEGRNNGSDIILVDDSKKGFILIYRHDYASPETLQNALKQGYTDDEMNIIVKGGVSKIRDSVFTYTGEGYFEGKRMKVMAIANFGQFGHGAIIISMVPSANFDTEKIKTDLLIIAEGMAFFPVEQHPLAKQWSLDLMGKSLKRGLLSSSLQNDNGEGGSESWVNLCENFSYKMIDKSGVNPRNIYSGEWTIEVHYGQPHLILIDNTGQRFDFKLKVENGRLFMNQERWVVLKGFEAECQ